MRSTTLKLGWAVLFCAASVFQARSQEPALPLAEECQTCEVCPPPSRWEFTGGLLYMQPGASNLEYATLISPLPVPTPNWANQAITPDFSPGFNVGLRYLVPESGNDIQVGWSHLETSDGASVDAEPDQFLGPSYEIGPDAFLYLRARGKVDFGWDSVNLDIGHTFDTGGPARVRFFGGVQYARIQQEVAAHFASITPLFAIDNATQSLFNGVGPRLGAKSQFALGNFDLLGEFAGSLLVGRNHSRIDFDARTPELVPLGITPPNSQSLTSPDAIHVVPSLDAKLGGGYTYTTRNGGIFRIEAGYQMAVYMNAINDYALSQVPTPPVDQSVGVYLRTAEHTLSDFTLHGPYFSASWSY